MCKKNLLTVAFFATIVSLLSACSASKQTASSNPEVPKILPKFDYSPKNGTKVGSSNLTIALVSPAFGDPSLTMNPFEDMRKSMANDFEELLTSKGFKVRGPFNQVGEMLYNDKQNSDFIFLVEIDLNFKNIDRTVKWNSKTNWGAVLTGQNGEYGWYTYTGQGTFVCNLTLTATSTKFGEKLWKKNITLPPSAFKYIGTRQWSDNRATLYDEVMQDNTVYNAVAKVLESQYQQVFDLVERQIEVEEMKTVSVEAHKVDAKP